jgi:thioredoxin 1
MSTRLWKALSAVVFAAALMLPAVSAAGAAEPFNAKAFAKAQEAGRPILVDVHASWCPVCRAQQPAIKAAAAKRPQLVVYRVDFDTQKDALRQFKAQRQSTLIMFKGKQEVGRLSYDSDPDRIAALVAKGF